MLRIVIPTHNRVNRQITLGALPTSLRAATVLVASTEDEAEALRRQYRVKVLVAPVHSIATKRQWILENIKDQKIFMLDDDMTFFGRSPPHLRDYRNGRWKTKPGHKGLSASYINDSKLENLFGQLEHYLGSYLHVGISSRLGNDTEQDEMRFAPQRMMHAFGHRRGQLLKMGIRFDAVWFREDFHVTLELLKRGYMSAVRYDICVSPGAYGAPGGCTNERTVKASDDAAERLAMLHAPFVKVVDKDYKGTPRKEVMVFWKKAYEASQRR